LYGNTLTSVTKNCFHSFNSMAHLDKTTYFTRVSIPWFLP
jgi:hypothetical protein